MHLSLTRTQTHAVAEDLRNKCRVTDSWLWLQLHNALQDQWPILQRNAQVLALLISDK